MKPEEILSTRDFLFGRTLLNGWREPDLTIAPDGQPYLYRWHIVRRNKFANVYMHIQVASDPERPLHDHPWDNTSVILSGAYEEILDDRPGRYYYSKHFMRQVGDTIYRKAEWAHRLILPHGILYTMTLFTTGPERREWGFWYPKGWVPHHEVTRLDTETRMSLHVKPENP